MALLSVAVVVVVVVVYTVHKSTGTNLLIEGEKEDNNLGLFLKERSATVHSRSSFS